MDAGAGMELVVRAASKMGSPRPVAGARAWQPKFGSSVCHRREHATGARNSVRIVVMIILVRIVLSCFVIVTYTHA